MKLNRLFALYFFANDLYLGPMRFSPYAFVTSFLLYTGIRHNLYKLNMLGRRTYLASSSRSDPIACILNMYIGMLVCRLYRRNEYV